jgi:hydrophobic/amphiphilic exporter-1 (mainly G- bacteria), HAE1 family
MKLIEASVRYPVSVLVGAILAVLFGVLALMDIPLQMAPTVDRPVISVKTTWTGASPREVEEEITDKLEEKLNSVEGVYQISSTSSDSESNITLKFDWGVNKDVARLDVSEKIALVGDLPDEADEPVIAATSSDEEEPFCWIVTHTKLPVNELRVLGGDVIKPRFERVEGVGGVQMYGGEDREVRVVVDAQALAARGIPLGRVRDALQSENRNVKAGGLEEGKRRYVVRTVGQFVSVKDIEDTLIGWFDGQSIRVRDVARVELGYAERYVTVKQLGIQTVVFGILKKTGANTVEVMKKIHAVIDWVNEQYGAKGVTLEAVYDETEYIDDSVSIVTNNLLYGAALAVVVLLLFLRSGISTLIVACSIPLSVIVTFIFLNVFDRTLNIISLAGLAFAVGMVVDNAIVVLENVFRHQEMGKDPFRAAFDGAREVWGAILSSTLTTLAVFIPILFIEQEAGQLFKDLAIALSVSIGMSLVVSITVIPMMTSRLLKVGKKERVKFLGNLGSGVGAGITRAVAWLTAGFVRKTATVVVIVVAAGVLAVAFAPPLDYLPQGNRPFIFCMLLTPPGFSPEEMDEIVGRVEKLFLGRPEVEHMFSVSLPDDPIIGLILADEYSDKETIRGLVAEFQGQIFAAGIPGISFPLVMQMPLFGRGGFGGGDLEITIRGPDLDTILGLSMRILGTAGKEEFMKKAGFTSVRSSFESGLPEMRIRVDREKAAALGMTVSDVGYAVGTIVDGTRAGDFRENGREIDLKLMADGGSGSRTQDVLRTPLVTPSGDLIQLGDVASVDFTTGPAKIEHTDLDRSIQIQIGVNPTIPLDQARDALDVVLHPIRESLPGLEYSIDLTGQARDLDLTWKAVQGSFLLAVIIVYLLMSALFESFASPFVILLSVPMALTGGVFGVAIARAFDPTVKLDVITMLGFVILAGIVVNNAILIVHQALNNIREGLDSRAAIIESVRSRVRPIFMSSTTSIMGMLPLVLAGGSGTELYRGLGAVVVGGLALSTVFTLFLIPCLFSLALDFRAWISKVFGWKTLEEALRETHTFRAS